MSKIKTEREFVERVLEMIDTTHWTTNQLACPVYEVKRTGSGRVMRERNPEYDPEEADLYQGQYGVSKTRTALVRDASGAPVITKWTYCLVGLFLKVAGLSNEDMEEDDLYVAPGKRAPLVRLAARVNDIIFAKLAEEGKVAWRADKATELTERVSAVEVWNDHSSKEQVRDLLVRVRDSLPESS